jgi:flagellar L-ring protein precursor FlgH
MKTLLSSLVILLGCGPSAHIEPYEPKSRTFSLPPEKPTAAREVTSGSLWRDGQLAGALFVDARAFRVNDIVLVKVEEVADAERSADTDVKRRSSTAASLAAAIPLLGPLIAPYPSAVDGSGTASSDATFNGGGTTNRKERLIATVSTVVKQVLSNGNLFIEGHRVILVNNEEHRLYVSGIIRPIDVDQENSVPSSKVGEAEIEFVGRGAVSDNGNQGVMQRFFNYLWPF